MAVQIQTVVIELFVEFTTAGATRALLCVVVVERNSTDSRIVIPHAHIELLLVVMLFVFAEPLNYKNPYFRCETNIRLSPAHDVCLYICTV